MSPKNTKQQTAKAILALNPLPQSWLIIFVGLKDHTNLPWGSGKWGCWFGSSLPFPTGFFLASASVNI